MGLEEKKRTTFAIFCDECGKKLTGDCAAKYEAYRKFYGGDKVKASRRESGTLQEEDLCDICFAKKTYGSVRESWNVRNARDWIWKQSPSFFRHLGNFWHPVPEEFAKEHPEVAKIERKESCSGCVFTELELLYLHHRFLQKDLDHVYRTMEHEVEKAEELQRERDWQAAQQRQNDPHFNTDYNSAYEDDWERWK